VKGLEELPNLRMLNLNNNLLTDIDALYGLPQLENLAVEFNKITKINLFALSKLKHLFLCTQYNTQLATSSALRL
jgi:Leucine-rich repeat (LRR) protein